MGEKFKENVPTYTYSLFLKWANSYLVKLFNKDGLFALHVVHIVRNSEKNGFLKERKKKKSVIACVEIPAASHKQGSNQASQYTICTTTTTTFTSFTY